MSHPLVGTPGRPGSITVAVLVILALAPIGVSRATSPMSDELPHVLVRYADLNLSSDADAAVLLQRIESAAGQVCSGYTGPVPLDRWMMRYRCYEQAVAHAVASVGAAKLSAAYRVKYQQRRLYSAARAKPLQRIADSPRS